MISWTHFKKALIRDFVLFSVLLLIVGAIAYRMIDPTVNIDANVGMRIMSVEPEKVRWVEFESRTLLLRIDQLQNFNYTAQLSNKNADDLGKTISALEFRARREHTLAFLSYFYPLDSIRFLGDAKQLKLGEFGLAYPEGRITFQDRGNTPYTISYGKSLRDSRVYIMNQAGQVFIGTDAPLQIIRDAMAYFFETRITDMELKNVTSATLNFENRGALVVSNFHMNAKEQWGCGNKPILDCGLWFQRLFQVKVFRPAPPHIEKILNSTPAVLALSLHRAASGDIQRMEFKKIPRLEGSSHRDPPYSYWVKSDFLGSYGEMNETRFANLVEDPPFLSANTSISHLAPKNPM